MRTTMMLVLAVTAGCELASDATAVQAVAGPSVTVTVRDAGQLAVSWTADPAAAQYQVFQSASGEPLALAATVFDSGGGAPSTSWIATGLTGGVQYCYAIKSAYSGSMSELGAAGCGTATGAGGATSATRTLVLPLTAPFVTSTSIAAALPMSASSSTAFVPFALSAGSTITATRAVIADNVSGPTTLRVGLMTVDGAGTGAATASGFGPASAGTGAIQPISSAQLSASVQSGRWYAVEVIYASGAASASVKAAEVDYIPAP